MSITDEEKYRAHRESEKAEAVAEIRAAIANLKVVSQPLDKWQRMQLARALSDGFNGVYRMSRCSAQLVTCPADRRSDAFLEEEPEIQRLTLADFERHTGELEIEPAKMHPTLFRR